MTPLQVWVERRDGNISRAEFVARKPSPKHYFGPIFIDRASAVRFIDKYGNPDLRYVLLPFQTATS